MVTDSFFSRVELFVKSLGKIYIVEINPNYPDIIVGIFENLKSQENIIRQISLEDFQKILTAYYQSNVNHTY